MKLLPQNSLPLEWLQSSAARLKGVGPQSLLNFQKLKISNFEDLLYHLPMRYLDRSRISQLHEIKPGEESAVVGEVLEAKLIPLKNKKIFQVLFSDQNACFSAKWFHFSPRAFYARFQVGRKFLVLGEFQRFHGETQIVHPEVHILSSDLSEDGPEKFLGILPIYPSVEGLGQNQWRRWMAQLLTDLPELEYFPADILAAWNLAPLSHAFRRLHQPIVEDLSKIISSQSHYRRRLVFDDFFFLQLGLKLRHRGYSPHKKFFHQAHFELQSQWKKTLPFQLTPGQEKAVQLLTERMRSPEPMNCLLQGDVGSGKTLVAAFASLLALENAYQVAFLAPTEILASQHFQSFEQWFTPLGLDVALLTSSSSKAERQKIQSQLQSGKPLLLLGTHALLEDKIEFKKLSLVVVDEQHRFGVQQRLQLLQKGSCPDVLVMTATPIPRSLALTYYGDIELCTIRDLPLGRKSISTRVLSRESKAKFYQFLREKIEAGRQAYFIFPLIEENEKLALLDVQRAYERLQKFFPHFKIAMLHGRMKSAEKAETMQKFSQGEIQILMATTVIEVGIDVPNASIMVVEHAERFGLAQLHQLRGRVGRGEHRSYCFLSLSADASAIARQRLALLESCQDGFRIAEEDLQLRGPGDVLGTRQSGVPDLRVANLLTDLDLLEAANTYVENILEMDSQLKLPEHQALRIRLKQRWQGRLNLSQVG